MNTIKRYCFGVNKVVRGFIKIVYLVIIIFCIGCVPKEKRVNSQQLKVISYNIHHGKGVDGVLDLERIAQVINTASPDIVALQEVDMHTKRSGNENQLKKLAVLCNMNFAFGKAMNWDGGEYGNAILSKFLIIKQKTFPLPGEPRCAIVTTLKHKNGNNFVFISLHLDNHKEPRENSLPFLVDIINQFNVLPLILAGDLNATPYSKVINLLQDSLINATENLCTIPVGKPDKQIDYIMYSPKHNWKVISSTVLEESIASDHRPIMSVFKMP